MRAYQEKRSKRKLVIGVAAVVVITSVIIIMSLISSNRYVAEVFPTDTAMQTITPTPLPPTPTPYPSPKDWDLTVELEDWQKSWLMADLQKFWAVYMTPLAGPPDCDEALKYVYSVNKNAQGSVRVHCDHVEKAGVYHLEFPLERFSMIAFYTFPEENYILVELDTFTQWGREIRYTTDGKLQKTEIFPRSIYRIGLIWEDNLWKVGAIEVLVEGESF